MLRLLMLGYGYWPGVKGNHKFWSDMAPLLKERVNYLAIASFTDQANSLYYQEPDIPVYNFKTWRPFGKINQAGYRTSYPEAFISLLRALKKLSSLIREHNINVIHLMDNASGPSTLLLKKFMPQLHITTSALAYHYQSRLYKILFRLNFEANFDKIITYSEALREKIKSIGVREDKLKTIRWGVNPYIRKQYNDAFKKTLNIAPESKVILWSGYLQQSGYEDFLLSLNVARRVVKRTRNCHFLFAFKPYYFKPEYLDYAEERISIVTDVNLEEIYPVTDSLLSPFSAVGTIVAPPLTWLEAMSYGIPVITTGVGGADEAIINNSNGYITSPEGLETAITNFLESTDTVGMGNNARKMVEQKYNIISITNDYIALWRSMIMNKTYRARNAYQNDKVASVYDAVRFGSRFGKLADEAERVAMSKLLLRIQQNGPALDLACGTGRLTGQLLAGNSTVVGTDIAREMLQITRQRLGNEESLLGLIQADAEYMPFGDDSFECVTSSRFMAHIPRAIRMNIWKELHRISRRWLIISYLNPLSLLGIYRAIVRLFRGNQRDQLSRRSLRKELEQAGFSLVKVEYCCFSSNDSSPRWQRALLPVANLLLKFTAETYLALIEKKAL
jgi:glycosyltransferase involved in cell wall biosynthesis